MTTCGPASAATILRWHGIRATERELAEESFTSRTGTENWYLARVLGRRGIDVKSLHAVNLDPPLPSIAGVQLPEAGNAGHFIVLLQRLGDRLLVADPMIGPFTNTMTDLRDRYKFTGSFMSATLNTNHNNSKN